MNKKRSLAEEIIPLVTMAILFVVILMVVVFAAVSYQRAVEIQDGNGNTRAVLSYAITAVRANAANPVCIEERDGRQTLVIQETATGYEQMLFQADGSVYEAYGEAGMIPDPEDALRIGETERFELLWKQEDLLEIRTDAGNSYIRVQTRADVDGTDGQEDGDGGNTGENDPGRDIQEVNGMGKAEAETQRADGREEQDE